MARPPDSSVYYSGLYWNNLAPVAEYMNRLATDDPHVTWHEHLLAHHGRPFELALILNCGNGWVERDLISRGVIHTAVGIDISTSLLAEARAAAGEAGLPITYEMVDINTYPFELDGVDLVLNVAAAHHITYIDRVFRRIAALLGDDGLFVSYDYVGPHRNCHRPEQWDALWQVNQTLPEPYRKVLHYPTIQSMIDGDPTEAVHSELIVPTMRRYFTLDHERYLGGGIAYDLLSLHDPMHQPSAERDAAVSTVLAADDAWRRRDPEANSQFAYLIARPVPAPAASPDDLARWTAEEETREAQATASGGRYFPANVLEHLYGQLDEYSAAANGGWRRRVAAILRRRPWAHRLAVAARDRIRGGA